MINAQVEDKVLIERILLFVEEVCDGIIQDRGWSAGGDISASKGSTPVVMSSEMIPESTPLRCRKLSNPDIFSSAGKTKLHRQLSQDDCKLRRGKQLLPLSNSVHSGVGQTLWQPPGDTSNLVRMRNQSLGQSAPSLTAGLGSVELGCHLLVRQELGTGVMNSTIHEFLSNGVRTPLDYEFTS
ncbi:hypothetical protein DV515_00004788 [Chloebia gouldiae]|uniref:Uncharacterized protein n=1 Tax=Chloebia gouldiae TaxID=44316 RepID=A0A3L8SPA1_CHLGU|nr:hypothetical protein DV515_00004788 [Chloebia gouldiae]